MAALAVRPSQAKRNRGASLYSSTILKQDPAELRRQKQRQVERQIERQQAPDHARRNPYHPGHVSHPHCHSNRPF
jgi:hypothetical protein